MLRDTVVRLCGELEAENTFQLNPFPLVQENGKCLNAAKASLWGAAEGGFVNAHG